MDMEKGWDWCIWILGKGGVLVGCKEWVSDLWRREPRWDFCCNNSSWEVLSLKWPRGDIYRRPRNDQNALLEDERSLCRGCHFRGWTTAADQPRQAFGVSGATLPRLTDRGRCTAAPLRGFCRHAAAAARPRHFMRGSLEDLCRHSAACAPTAALLVPSLQTFHICAFGPEFSR